MCKCSGKKAAELVSGNRRMTSAMTQQLFETDPDFVQVKYIGPQYARMVKSPSGALTRYGAKSYGLYTNGAVIYVHKDDVKAAPQMFAPLQPIESFAATKPKVEAAKVEEPKAEEPKVDATSKVSGAGSKPSTKV